MATPIAKRDLIDDGLYRGCHRCCKFAVWHKAHNQFAYLGYSMGQYASDYAPHFEDDKPGWRLALFVPFELITLTFTDAECIEAGRLNK